MACDIRLQNHHEKRPKLARRISTLSAAAIATILVALAQIVAEPIAMAGEIGHNSGEPLPRFASLKADEVHFRQGPSQDHAIKWVLRRRHLPVKVIGEFGQWRRVELHTGERGWINRAMLSTRRFVIVLGQSASLQEAPQPAARDLASVAPAVPLRLNSCQREWCEVETTVGSAAENADGWVLKRRLWGVD